MYTMGVHSHSLLRFYNVILAIIIGPSSIHSGQSSL